MAGFWQYPSGVKIVAGWKRFHGHYRVLLLGKVRQENPAEQSYMIITENNMHRIRHAHRLLAPNESWKQTQIFLSVYKALFPSGEEICLSRGGQKYLQRGSLPTGRRRQAILSVSEHRKKVPIKLNEPWKDRSTKLSGKEVCTKKSNNFPRPRMLRYQQEKQKKLRVTDPGTSDF